jgi:hypothetical protein
MKRLFVLVGAMWACAASADVSEASLWQPAPGRSAEMYQAASEARAIQEKLGAVVFIGTDQLGQMLYETTFKDWGAWAAFVTKMRASKEWTAWVAKYFVANPNSTQVGSWYLNSPVVGKTQAVTAVYSWDINNEVPGAFDAFMAIAQQAVPIQAALGGSPGINIDELGNVHYSLSFDSWESWAKFNAALEKSTEWAALLKKANEKPTAELVKVYMVDTYTGP